MIIKRHEHNLMKTLTSAYPSSGDKHFRHYQFKQ